MKIILERRSRQDNRYLAPTTEVVDFTPPDGLSETDRRIAAWDAAARFAREDNVRAISVSE